MNKRAITVLHTVATAMLIMIQLHTSIGFGEGATAGGDSIFGDSSLLVTICTSFAPVFGR